MSGARSRRTGATFERQVARLLREATGTRWSRTKGGEAQPLGDVAPDADDPPPPPFDLLFVECKAHASLRGWHLFRPTEQIRGWWSKARTEAEAAGKLPALVMRVRRFGCVVALPRCMEAEIAESTNAAGDRWRLHCTQAAWSSWPSPVVIVDAEALLTPTKDPAHES